MNEPSTVATYDSQTVIETEESMMADLSTKISNAKDELSTANILRNYEYESIRTMDRTLLGSTKALAGVQEKVNENQWVRFSTVMRSTHPVMMR